MNVKNNFVKLAEVQRAQGTLYCGGLDIHAFGSYAKNLEVYGSAVKSHAEKMGLEEKRAYYNHFFPEHQEYVANMLANVESHLIKKIDNLLYRSNIRIYKFQSAFYEQFGPAGMFLLSRANEHIKKLEIANKTDLIRILDCKRGDIDTTQAAYLTGLLGNLLLDWGMDYKPYDFDIINVTPWMGDDVFCLGTEEKPGLGLQLMRAGKGIISVNLSSNPSGPQYQNLPVRTTKGEYVPMHMVNVSSLNEATTKYELEYDGLSTLGLVVGSTHQCNGFIRLDFPTTTLLVPGFGAQGGKFSLIMPELIRKGKWNGQGAIFSSSRGTMYPWLAKLGGSGDVNNDEADTIKAIETFRANEKAAYLTPEVQEMGIVYPFAE
jgi:orotidine 5'-phosphate decarboxylase subfamily 2